MRAGLVLLVLGVGLLVAPARSELGAARTAEGYAERVVEARLLELPPTSSSATALLAPLSIVRQGRRRGVVAPLDVASALPGAIAARGLDGDGATAARALGGVLVSIFLFAALGAVLFARLRRPDGLALPPGAAVAATLGALFGSSLLLGARRADASLLAALALLLLLERLASPAPARARHFLGVGLLGTALILALPSYAVCALALALFELLRRHADGRALVARALLAGLPLLAALAVTRVWDARVALAPTPSSAPFHALYGLLLSPGRSLFVYSPLALLGLCGISRLWTRDRGRAEAIAIALCTALPAIALRADWHGDPSFGPPQLVPLLPLLAEPAAVFLVAGAWGRATFAAVTCAGVLVQSLGLGVGTEAWPRLVADVRVATGAPAWFLDPAADIEFVPQLSPIAGHLLLLRANLGRPMPSEPPFALVVGSDQAAPAKGAATAATIWSSVWEHFDKASCRPNLALVAWPRALARKQATVALALAGLGGLLMLVGAARERRQRWPRG